MVVCFLGVPIGESKGHVHHRAGGAHHWTPSHRHGLPCLGRLDRMGDRRVVLHGGPHPLDGAQRQVHLSRGQTGQCVFEAPFQVQIPVRLRLPDGRARLGLRLHVPLLQCGLAPRHDIQLHVGLPRPDGVHGLDLQHPCPDHVLHRQPHRHLLVLEYGVSGWDPPEAQQQRLPGRLDQTPRHCDMGRPLAASGGSSAVLGRLVHYPAPGHAVRLQPSDNVRGCDEGDVVPGRHRVQAHPQAKGPPEPTLRQGDQSDAGGGRHAHAHGTAGRDRRQWGRRRHRPELLQPELGVLRRHRRLLRGHSNQWRLPEHHGGLCERRLAVLRGGSCDTQDLGRARLQRHSGGHWPAG
mmetsp:Transcript_125307/g.217199  ORF Transcript_125307/g.217199 Transcript_125307/m.217199 type:complete len:350 (-) Transcript_125307:2484-3533(-)